MKSRANFVTKSENNPSILKYSQASAQEQQHMTTSRTTRSIRIVSKRTSPHGMVEPGQPLTRKQEEMELQRKNTRVASNNLDSIALIRQLLLVGGVIPENRLDRERCFSCNASRIRATPRFNRFNAMGKFGYSI